VSAPQPAGVGPFDPSVLDPSVPDRGVEVRVPASFARPSMPRTLGVTMVEVGHGRVVLEMPGDPRFGQ
jgi:acyl-coenzyme A thioesterase PaaI-like protein